MAAPRKIFRIEQMTGARLASPANGTSVPGQSDVMQELGALRAMLAAPACAGAAPRATAPTARIAGELDAVIRDCERATQKILAASEYIDHAANNLAATLEDDFERGLMQDVRDRVMQIFEACNVQDVTRQRVAKVTTLLGQIERQIAGALKELTHVQAAPSLHGPPLPGDVGHATQSEIDSILASGEPAV